MNDAVAFNITNNPYEPIPSHDKQPMLLKGNIVNEIDIKFVESTRHHVSVSPKLLESPLHV